MGRLQKFGILGLLLAVVLLPAHVRAQDPLTPLTETITTSDGRLTVNYPEGWAAMELFGVYLSNNAELLETFEFENLPRDAFLMVVLAGPINEMTNLSASATFEDVWEVAEEDAQGADFDDYVGPKTTEFQGMPAYRTIGKVDDQEAIYLYVDIGEGNILQAIVLANTGEMQRFSETIEAVVASAEYIPPAPPVITGSVIWQDTDAMDFSSIAPVGAVAVGPDETIYIAGYYAGIAVYDTDGRYQRAIGEIENDNSSRWAGFADDIAVAPDGTLWIVDGNQRVYHINENGSILQTWGELGQDSGEFGEYSPDEIEVLATGQVVIQDSQEVELYVSYVRLQVWDEDGTLVKEFVPDPPGFADTINGYAWMEMGPDGLLYIAEDAVIWQVDLETEAVTGIQLSPSPLDETWIEEFAITPTGGFVFVGYESGVFQFDAQGRYISQFGEAQPYDDSDTQPRFAEGEFSNPDGVAVLPNGDVIVSDSNYDWWQVVRFTFDE
jgi:hypothetical protein